MIVTCAPLWEGDPRPVCGKVYNDAHRWTLCPHPYLDDPEALRLLREHEDEQAEAG